MTVCIRCHRPLKQPTETGMGPTCSKRAQAQAVPAHERDLFGYDIDKAVHAARYRLQVCINSMAAEASMALRASYREALERVREVRPVRVFEPVALTTREQELMDLMAESGRLLDEYCGIPKGGRP